MSDIQIENQETEPKRFVKLRIALGLLPDPHGRPSFLWLERWNAYIITIFVGFGLPAPAPRALLFKHLTPPHRAPM